jgi:hypothetical protein
LSESNPLAVFGDFGKPANTLIEKISDAFGGIFKPKQIRRVARAECDAEIMRATTQIQITELQRRALERFVAEEGRKQENIESITAKALPEISDEAKPESMEDDWIVNFFDKCRLVSDAEMQKIWSRVLAGEANSPGRFSKRTIDLVASLDKSDAESFARLCDFAIPLHPQVVPLIYDPEARIYVEHGVNFGVISHLDGIGLVQFSALTGFTARGVSEKGVIRYHGHPIWIEFPKPDNNNLDIGKVLLTKAGHEIAGLCDTRPVNGFVEYLRETWKNFGYKTEPTPPPTISAVAGFSGVETA